MSNINICDVCGKKVQGPSIFVIFFSWRLFCDEKEVCKSCWNKIIVFCQEERWLK